MLTNRCEKMHVVLLINQKDYVHYNQQTSTNEIRFTPALSEAEGRYASRSARTSAQKNLFMQNKPNLLNAQMNVNSVLTMDYVNIRLRSRFENKAKQTQFKPNQTQFYTICAENKPNQTQNKPNL